MQVHHSIDEFACSAIDVLARRTRLAFVNAKAAEYALPRVTEIMAERFAVIVTLVVISTTTTRGYQLLLLLWFSFC